MENPIEINTQLHLVTFRLDRQIYALPIEPIRQIIEMVTITPVPQVRASVEGVINFHGVVIPVVNLREHLGMQKTYLKLHTPIIMVFVFERLVGLIVDEVMAVLDVPSSQIVRPRDILPEGLGNPSLLRGLFYAETSTVLLLDIENLFAPQEATALAEIITALPVNLEPPEEQKPEPQDMPRHKSKKKRATKKVQDDQGIPEIGSAENPE